MPAVLQVVHGYPPWEVAGTEVATRRLVDGLLRRGWRVHVFSATIAPGQPQYTVLEEPGLTRVVNNLPWRTLESVESDRCIDLIFKRILLRERPDVVHIQHLAMLSSTIDLPVPSVGTLHDHWAWCPAGGTLLQYVRGQPNRTMLCSGPDPVTCPACHAAWRRPLGRTGQAILDLAGRVSPWVTPKVLHGMWRHVPTALRRRAEGPRSVPLESPGSFLRRQAAFRDFWRNLGQRMAPSEYLASKAEKMGLGPVAVVPHGMDPTSPALPVRPERGPFIYLGSILPHKGVHLVVEAYRQAFGDRGPGLVIHGNDRADPVYARSLNWPLAGPLPDSQVPALLARSSALVMGSIWPENAPLVILEARSVGCPVVAPAIGGIPEGMVHERDGFLYAPGCVDDMVRGLCRVAHGARLPVKPPPSLDSHLDAVEGVYEQATRGWRAHG